MNLTNTTMTIKIACVLVLAILYSPLPAQAQAREDGGGGIGEYAYTNNLPDPAGQTFVLDGLLLQTNPTDLNGDKIPFFSNIPVLGGLFRNTRSNGEGRRNLLIFLTPRVIREE